MKATINSLKHMVQFSLNIVSSGAVSSHDLIVAAVAPDFTIADEVRLGAIVKAIHCEMWFRGSDAGAGSTYVAVICKHMDDSSNPSAGDMAALNVWNNKNNILWTGMGLINADDSVATPVNNFWLKIPKGKQKFNRGDTLKLHLFAQSGTVERCGAYIFKEYF